MKTEIRDITPETAKDMLKRNGNNRDLNDSHVRFLSNEMTRGNWMFDGQPLRFSEDGVLLDGQHRLNALIRSKTSQKFLVITGISKDAFTVMDTGKNRSASDIFSIEGIPNATACASITRLILMHSRGQFSGRGAHGSKPSNTDVLNHYLNNIRIGEYASDSATLYRKFRRTLELSQLGCYYYLMAQKNDEKATEFWNGVCTGVNLQENSPIHLLREKLLSDAISIKKYNMTYKRMIIFKAWNFFRKGKELSQLKISDKEKIQELI